MLEMLAFGLLYLLLPKKESSKKYNTNNDIQIRYGINGRGEYKPISIGGEYVTYGINGRGEYAPIRIGNKRIIYGINGRGEYVPIRMEE